MSTLTEVQAMVDALGLQDKQQLLLYLAERLRAQGGSLPPPRRFSREQIAAWISEDEQQMQRLLGDKAK